MERKIMLVAEVTEDAEAGTINIKLQTSDNEVLFTVVQDATTGQTTLIGADGQEI